MDFLPGKKTHLAAIGVILAAVGSYLTGEVTLGQAVMAALGGLGLSSARLGVKKVEDKVDNAKIDVTVREDEHEVGR